MREVALTVRHLLAPGATLAEANSVEGETIAAFLERSGWEFKLPTICVLNGEPVLRAQWASTTLCSGDLVVFLSRPFGGNSGGGNKMTQVLGIVALIALTALAAWAGPLIAGSVLGLSGTALTVGGGLITAAIGLGGSLLISTLMKVSAGGQNDNPEADGSNVPQLYSLTVASNSGRPFEPIPVQYGRIKTLPDYAATPWGEYIGDDQFANILLVQGMGHYQAEEIFIDDTVLWDSTNGLAETFSDVQIEFYGPGEPVTLFPVNVVSSDSVNGQEVTTAAYVGPFIANAAGTTATHIAFDVVLPSGLFSVDNNGNVGNAQAHFIGEIRKIDNSGTPLTSWEVVVSEVYDLASRAPKRFSHKVEVPEGRYEARVKRGNPESTENNVSDGIAWGGLRAFLKGVDTFQNVSVVAIRIRASQQLTATSAKKFSILQTRILPVWDGDGWDSRPTRNPVWAAFDVATNPIYGGGLSIGNIDFDAWVTLADAARNRFDRFDYVFKSAVPVPDAIDTCLTATRSKHYWVGDVLSVTRDQWYPVPDMLLSDQQIIRGSMEVDYTLNPSDSSDCVIAEFLNENTWQPAELQFPPNDEDFVGTKPFRVRIEGILNADHLQREICFLYRQSQLRRTKVTLTTEHDGRLLRLLSPVKVQSFLPRTWGQSGEVVSRSGNTVVVDRDLKWESAQHYVEFRSKTGGYFGPIRCQQGANVRTLNLNSLDLSTVTGQLGISLADALERMDGSEPPAFVFGKESNLSRNALVLKGAPSGDRVTLTLVLDSPEVHDFDAEDIPAFPTRPPTADPRIPTVAGLVAKFKQGQLEPFLEASWWPSPGAIFFKAWVSYDGGESWLQIWEGAETRFSVVTVLGALTLRVAAFNSRQGPFAYIDVPTIDVSIGGGSFGWDSFDDRVRDYVDDQFRRWTAWMNKTRQIADAAAAEADAQSEISNMERRRDVISQDGRFTTITNEIKEELDGATAAITETYELAVGTAGAFASYQVTVAATFEDINAAIETNQTAIADTNGALATFQTEINASMSTANANISSNATAIANTNTAISNLDTTLTAQIGSLSSSVSVVAGAVADINGTLSARYGVRVQAGNVIGGFELLSDGSYIGFNVNADLFRVSFPGVGGGSPVPVWQIANVNGVAKIVWRGDMVGDGTLTTRMVMTGLIQAGSGIIANLAVESLQIGDNAVTVPHVSFSGSVVGNGITDWELNWGQFTVNTNGLAGKPITILCQWTWNNIIPNGSSFDARIGVNGSDIARASGSFQQSFITLTGAFTTTATGGVMTFTVVGKWFGSGGTQAQGGVLTSVAVKR